MLKIYNPGILFWVHIQNPRIRICKSTNLSFLAKSRKLIPTKKRILSIDFYFIEFLLTVACKWCVPSAFDFFLSRNDNSGGKTREASEGVEYDLCLYIQTLSEIVATWYVILYFYCMLVREIWKFIHPRVSYSLRATPEGNMILVGEYISIVHEPACYECFIIPNETKKTHTCQILLANIF